MVDEKGEGLRRVIFAAFNGALHLDQQWERRAWKGKTPKVGIAMHWLIHLLIFNIFVENSSLSLVVVVVIASDPTHQQRNSILFKTTMTLTLALWWSTSSFARFFFDVMSDWLISMRQPASHLPQDGLILGSDVMGCGHSNDDGVGIHLARGLKGVDDNAAVVYGTMDGEQNSPYGFLGG